MSEYNGQVLYGRTERESTAGGTGAGTAHQYMLMNHWNEIDLNPLLMKRCFSEGCLQSLS